MNRFLKTIQTAVLLAMACVGLASCGGGEDTSSEPPIAVTFDIRSFTATVPEGSHSFSSVTATLSALPAGPVYAFILMDRPVLRAGSVVASRNANGSFTETFEIDPALAAGRYTGSFTLMLCKDPACSRSYPLSGAVLPYDITVAPAIILSVMKNGAPSSPNGMYYALQVGDQIVVTSSVPTTWNVALTGGATNALTGVAQTPTTWRATASQAGVLGELQGASTALPGNIGTVRFSID